MSSNNGLSRKNVWLTAAAVGAGAIFGAAGLLMYFLNEKKVKNKTFNDSFSSLSQLSSSRWNKAHCSSQESLVSALSSSTATYYETADEMLSNKDDDDDDFFTWSDDEKTLSSAENFKDKLDKKNFFEEVDTLMDGNDDDQLNAFNLLKENEFKQSNNPEFLWRFAKAHQIQASAENDLETKKKLVSNGLKYASDALAIDVTNPDAHKWFAILTGMEGEFLSITEKIEKAHAFQKHLLAALNNKNNDYSLHYLLGRFKYEIGITPWWQRKIASRMFGEIPSCTTADAIPHLRKAEELSPKPWKESKLLLAKCYVNEGKFDEAFEWLRAAKKIPPRTKVDKICDREIDSLLEKYKTYRK